MERSGMRRLPGLLAFVFAIAAPPVIADDCLGNGNAAIVWTTPATLFADNGDGTLTDTRTGLMWLRCPLGQTWTGAACDGEPDYRDWPSALVAADGGVFAGFNDWRLPNIKELASIVEQRCRMPAQNASLFPARADELVTVQPDPPADPGDPQPPAIPEAYLFWTASPFALNANYAWVVDFRNGVDTIKTKGSALRVRLVRDRDVGP